MISKTGMIIFHYFPFDFIETPERREGSHAAIITDPVVYFLFLELEKNGRKKMYVYSHP